MPCSRGAAERSTCLCQLLYNQKQRIPDSHRSLRFNCVASRVAGRGKQQLHVRAGRISDNVPGLPTCRASGMSAGPNAPSSSATASPAAAPLQAARAATLLLSEVRQPLQPAGARSHTWPATSPAPSHHPRTRVARQARPLPFNRKRAASRPMAPSRPAQSGPPSRALPSPLTHSPSYGARLPTTAKPDSTPAAREATLFSCAQSAHLPNQHPLDSSPPKLTTAGTVP
jgi:hypothetical protein